MNQIPSLAKPERLPKHSDLRIVLSGLLEEVARQEQKGKESRELLKKMLEALAKAAGAVVEEVSQEAGLAYPKVGGIAVEELCKGFISLLLEAPKDTSAATGVFQTGLEFAELGLFTSYSGPHQRSHRKILLQEAILKLTEAAQAPRLPKTLFFATRLAQALLALELEDAPLASRFLEFCLPTLLESQSWEQWTLKNAPRSIRRDLSDFRFVKRTLRIDPSKIIFDWKSSDWNILDFGVVPERIYTRDHYNRDAPGRGEPWAYDRPQEYIDRVRRSVGELRKARIYVPVLDSLVRLAQKQYDGVTMYPPDQGFPE